PGQDGLSTARQLKALGRQPMASMVLLSTHGHADIEDSARAEGIERVLVKPVHASMIASTMRTLSQPPAVAAQTRAEPPSSSSMAALAHAHGARILVVEDTALNRML